MRPVRADQLAADCSPRTGSAAPGTLDIGSNSDRHRGENWVGRFAARAGLGAFATNSVRRTRENGNLLRDPTLILTEASQPASTSEPHLPQSTQPEQDD